MSSCCHLVTKSCLTLFQPHGLYPARLLCPWDSPGKNTGVDYHFLLQGIFPTQGSNLHLENCRQILYHWASSEALASTIEMLLNPVFLFIPASLTALAQMSCLAFFFFGSFLLSFPHLSSISHTATKMSVFGNTDLRMAASNLETPAPINTPLVCSHIKNVDIAFQFLLLAAD